MSSNGKAISADWDNDDAARYRRPRQPVEIRRRAPWKQALKTAAQVFLVVVTVVAVGGGSYLVYRFATRAVIFRVANLEAVEVANADHVLVDAVREQFAADVGRSVFAVPLGTRRQSLEALPWVEAAVVQRVLPNRLRASIRERVPVAFLRQGQSLSLIDRQGVVLPMPEGASYTFPVINGGPETLSAGDRQARVQLYMDFVADLDRDEKHYSSQLSEIDLSDPEDIRASVTEADGAVWLHFGRGRYQEKFSAYLEHRPLWQQSGEVVRSVDLRYRGQIVLNPDQAAGERHP